MILGFKEFFDTKRQKPTYFKEKILLNASSSYNFNLFDGKKGETVTICRAAGEPIHYNTFQSSPSGWVKGELILHPKRHTIRIDASDKWKAGRSIQMVYRGAGYKIKNEFNNGFPDLQRCVSVQKITIKWSKDKSELGKIADMLGIDHKDVEVHIDDRWYASVRFNDGFAGHNHRDVEAMLYQNDGFDNLFDFFNYFNKDFIGKIIHWTDLRY